MKTIWCLFSVDNDYNQPKHNLVSWWTTKPDIDDLFYVLVCKDRALFDLLNNNTARIDDVFYSLKEVKEGERLK